MHVRDRIRELRRIEARQLRPHPNNWRMHPSHQRAALRGVLAEIGYADALVARELPEGGYELIDGHLRAETTPEMLVPVLVVDLSADEADKLLALHDALTPLAETDGAKLAALLRHVETDDPAVRAVLDNLENDARLARERLAAVEQPPLELRSLFQVVVECRDEVHQRIVHDQLVSQGERVRVLTLFGCE